MPTEVTDPNDSINLLFKALDEGSVGLVQAADKIEEELSARGHRYIMDIAPRQVGIDPINRDGEGGSAQQVLLLASDIFDVGFSVEATRHATCVEVIPGTRDVEVFNQKFAHGNGLATVLEDSIHFGSLSGGHTNYVLRCVADGVPSSRTEMCEKGKLSLDVIERKDAVFGQAVRQGLRWRVLRWQVRVMWPRALQIIQAARNVPSAMNRRVSEMQGLIQLHALAAVAQAKGEAVDWPSIKRAVLRAKPGWAEYADDLILFVAAKAGGVEGRYLEAMKRVFRMLDTSTRCSLPGGLYSALADFSGAYVAVALWTTAYTCPYSKENVSGGQCVWVKASDVKNLMHGGAATKALVAEAERCLATARLRLQEAKADVETNEVTKVLTALDTRVGRFLLQKQEASKIQYKSIVEICQQFVKDLCEGVPGADGSVYRDVWPLPATAPSHVPLASSSTPGAIGLVSINDKGDVTDARCQLRSAGFDVEAMVARKSDPTTVYKIVSISGTVDTGSVRLQKHPLVKADLPATFDVSEFLGFFTLVDARTIVELHPGWPACRSSKTDLGRGLRMKGTVIAALGVLVELLEPDGGHVPKVEVQLKPQRRVLSKAAVDAFSVFFPPETTNVKSFTDDAKATASPEELASLWPVQCEPPCPGYSFYLGGATQAENMAPAWYVRRTTNEAEANVRLTPVDVQILAGIDFLETEIAAPHLKRRKLVKKTPVPTTADEQVADLKITLPVMTNHKALKVNEELVLYRPATAKKAREAAAITMSTLAMQVRAGNASAAQRAAAAASSAAATF